LLLALQSACVTGQRPVGSDDPMTRNDDAQRIASGRSAYGSRASRMAKARRNLGIARCLAPGHLRDRVPHLALKWRSLRRKRQLEMSARRREIIFDLLARCAQNRATAILMPRRVDSRKVFLIGEIESAQRVAVCYKK